MKVLVTGSRQYKNDETIFNALQKLNPQTDTIIHGGARGADTLAGFIAKELGFKVIEVPAQWTKFGRAAGPIRNQEMLDMEPELVLAFHENLEESKGTKDMVTRSKKKGVKVFFYK